MLNFKSITNIEIIQSNHFIIANPLLADRIEKIWTKINNERKESLFNGKILSLTHINENKIYAARTEYKYFIAQITDQSLFNELKIRPLAVSGILESPDGYIFGQRHLTTQENNYWELVPSGSINYLTKSNNQLHIKQILTELEEEIGLTINNIKNILPIAIIEDEKSHVVDIGIYLKTELAFSDILNVFKLNGCNEYKEIISVSKCDVSEFINKHSIVPISKILILHLLNKV